MDVRRFNGIVFSILHLIVGDDDWILSLSDVSDKDVLVGRVGCGFVCDEERRREEENGER
jgi:hypothetical protein